MVGTGVMEDATEVRWDIRPAPRWGTIEVRACDGMSTLPELAAVAALVQSLVEAVLARARRGPRAHDAAALVRAREQVARRPLRARRTHHRRSRGHARRRCASTSARPWTASRDIAVELKCARELAAIDTILDAGCELRATADGGGCRGRRPARGRAAPHPRVPSRARRCATTWPRSATDAAAGGHRQTDQASAVGERADAGAQPLPRSF